ncbi:MAG: metallophosphoesterase family protein, partial [Clostridia bacterium]|nr:metallophosphoesterase family protein [Clostridia bacterium]
MKYLIASDIHGSASACRKLLERFSEEGADRILLLGENGQQWIADSIEYDADAGTAKYVTRVWYGRITST